MAADAYVTMRRKESRPVEGDCTPATGTITLVSATVTLTDTTGAVAGGVDGAAATVTSEPSATPSAKYQLRPSVLGIAAGRYQLAFLAIDSNGNEYEPVVGVKVLPDY